MKTRPLRIVVFLSFFLCFLTVPLLGSLAQDGAGVFLLPVFGSGPIKVKLYANYFCSPCRAFETNAEPVIVDLVKRKNVAITFVDTPFHKGSALYTKYFLMILNNRKDVELAITARKCLFEGARQGIQEQHKLEEFLVKNGMKFKPFDVQPVFRVLEAYIKEDKVQETPLCVIVNGAKKTVHRGAQDIMKALSALQ